MKTITIIPARGGSKRLPGKNIMTLGQFPLIAHSILYAKEQDFIDEVYVTTDDDSIKNVAMEFGARVIDRPSVISGDLEPTVSALKHVLHSIDNDIENVILLQPTNPLRPQNLVKEAFAVYLKENCSSLFTVTRNYHKLGKIDKNQFVPFNYEVGQRSQDLEPLYFENGLIYIAKASLIMNDVIIGQDAFPLVVDHPFADVDIDTGEDFDYALYLYNKFVLNL